MLQVICFSKNRPLQLHGYLWSLREYATDYTVKVLVSAQPKWYADAYAEVEREFPEVEWCYEQDFKAQLPALIGNAEYTMFGCDDVVFTRQFWPQAVPADVIGLSLRLGRHIVRDMFGQPMATPKHQIWSVDHAEGDWAYPWEVLGTIYPTEFASKMVGRIQASSPSQLEARGALCWREETRLRSFAANSESSLVVPTVNLVQEEYPNGIRGEIPLEVGFLLECWNHNLRLDVDRYFNMRPESWRIPEFYLTRV